MEQNETIEKKEEGVVLYTDGGSRGNGNGGWGIHGYQYTTDPEAKSAAHTQYHYTINGYVSKKQTVNEEEIVKPINYIDGYGSFSSPTTNNQAELVGASNAMFLAEKYDIKKCIVHTDSRYVVDGINKWLENWKKNDFIRPDNSEITNKSLWLQIDEQLNTLNGKNIEIEFRWIKAHNGHIGNELADRYATIGVMNSFANQLKSETVFSPSTGYWNYKYENHPFLIARRVYFLTRPDANTPGQYYIGDHGKEDELIGTKGCVGFITLNKPDDLVESTIQLQIKSAPNTDIITMILLDRLHKGMIARDIERFSDGAIYRNSPSRIDLYFADNEPITIGLVPPRHALNVINRINELKAIIEDWKTNKETKLVATEVTDSFFTKNKKGDLILNPDINVGTNRLNVSVKYRLNEDLRDLKLDLFLGADLPTRNALKRIEKKNPKVYVITYTESPECIKYYGYIEVDDGYGIWTSLNANTKYVIDINNETK